ncbi:MAG: GntR family transcriptional regulator [Nibricoccus sp.]
MARTREIPAQSPVPVAAVGENAQASHLGPQILRGLRERILSWHYPPGHHLGEKTLCEEFSASRIPVREALKALAEQGLVDQVPNMGCYVKQPDAEATHHLYDVRLALELFVVERLARSGFPADVAARERAFWEPLLAIKASAKFETAELVRADENFHLNLAKALGNPFLTESLEDINERLRFVRMAVITSAHRVQTTAGEHLKILEAIEAKDAEGARRYLRQNLLSARNKVDMAIAKALTSAHTNRKRGSG